MRQTLLNLHQKIDSPEHEYPESTNQYVDRLPAQPPLWPKDQLLFLQRAELLVMPVEQSGTSGWNVVVIAAPDDATYKPAGHRLFVGSAEIAAAVRVHIAVKSFE